MTKLSVIFFILKQRISNIFLVSIMFSSLIIIFMVGLGIKDVFYNYLRSDYGNVPDVKIEFDGLSNTKTNKLIDKIKQSFPNEQIDILSGYEYIDKVSIVDSEELLLTSGLPLFIKTLRFKNSVDVQIDGKKQALEVENISYVDELYVKLKLNGLKIDNKDSLKFLVHSMPLDYNFCKDILLEDDTITLQAKPCKTKADKFLAKLQNDNAKYLKLEANGNVQDQKIVFVDTDFSSLVLAKKGLRRLDTVSLAYKGIEIDRSFIQSYEIEDDQLIINFYQDSNMEKNYKLFLANILKDFINYNRMVLKLNLHTFENDDEDDKEDPMMVYLNELTDLVDLIFSKDMGNLAISSTFLAQDLNNFGILDNFTIKDNNFSYNVNIRSTIEYNPEKIYDKNILILNHNILDNIKGKSDINNYIDIYNSIFLDEKNIKKIENIVSKYTKSYKIIRQEDIIPSIKPKKFLFDTTVVVLALFILVILFIAMYIVLLQFYSNFNSELALLKLYGSKITYQAIINFVSFIISAGINYMFLVYEENIINSIMLKYFFVEFHISMMDYLISLSILLCYIIVNYMLEYSQIKKLNLIKGQ